MYVIGKKKHLSVDIQHFCIDVCDFLKPHEQNNVFYTIYDLFI